MWPNQKLVGASEGEEKSFRFDRNVAIKNKTKQKQNYKKNILLLLSDSFFLNKIKLLKVFLKQNIL